MTIKSTIQELAPGAIVELFELNVLGTPLYFHNGVNELGNDVVWQGNTYSRRAIQVTGFEWRNTGAAPRPIAKVGNIDGVARALVKNYNDLIGAKLTRRRTFVRYLDAINFPSGSNPQASPSTYLPDEVYFVARKSKENPVFVEFELAAAFDVMGVKLPRRQVVQNVCPWRYRSPECGWTTTPDMVNLLNYSEEFQQAVWTKSTAGTGSLPVVTANYSANPVDGAVTADRVVFNLGGGTTTADHSTIYQGYTSTTGQSYTFSIWAKSNDSNSYTLSFEVGSGAAHLFTVTPTWQKFTVTMPALSANYYPLIRLRGYTPITSNTADLSLFGAQFEAAASASAYQFKGAAGSFVTPKYYTNLDVATSDKQQDVCGKRLTSCECRWGENNELPFGGFPSAGLIR